LLGHPVQSREPISTAGLKDTPELDELGRPILSDGKLLLGDLGVRRDFGFAGDYAEVMHMVLQHPTTDDYVIGSGQDHSIQEFCKLAFQSVGLDWTDYVSVDPKLIRKTDSHYTRADPAKLRSVFNWRPRVTFQGLVSTMVEAQVKRAQDNMALERSCNPRLVSVAKDISPFKIRAIWRFSSTFFLAAYMCIVSHFTYEAC
jgi:GDPmannose 4,6-dehydratase